MSFTKGMTSKVVGNLSFPRNVGDQEVKDAALDLTIREGFCKSDKDIKGISIAKNIITVRC